MRDDHPGQAGLDSDGSAGTKRVHEYPRNCTRVVRAGAERPMNIGVPSPLDAHGTRLALDRTQEVAGSSPASSILTKFLQGRGFARWRAVDGFDCGGR